ncbi:LysE family translocator [Lentibacter sp. XHP0401]|uniref:LysE family translocator n=1 Tax=Lentibacter sp. XHP0401 TaxID=2984334 RepID=UPI0021E74949|nr:LysE family translocator [Lentibacter sp. XHP0401]MCV2893660.1 LysE family translocator [Lentibacter sp. XHP0401]
MTYEIFLALVLFAFVSSATPGPNNMMLLASGANFGFLRTIPHMLGIGIGFGFMIFCVGVGLMQVFDAYPQSRTILTVVSVIYMLWLAFKIANAAAPEGSKAGGSPMTFLQAAAFQWVNPKAWSMGLTAITLYAGDRTVWSVTLVAVAFMLVNLPSVSIWAVLGREMRRFLTSPARLRAFNWSMAALLLLSLYPVLMPQAV